MTAPTDFPWTEENVAKLRRLYDDGMSTGRIAAELGCPTRNAVIGKIHRLGLTREVTNVGSRPRKDGVVKKPIAAKPVRKAPTKAAPPPMLAIVRPEPPRIACDPAPRWRRADARTRVRPLPLAAARPAGRPGRRDALLRRTPRRA